MSHAVQPKKIWWKESVVYQVYPRSFKDSNGDGIGDLQGLISKLDYLKHLGIDVIWICPMFKSPMDDNGYDISDYQAIHDEFGTMEDFDQLLKGCHDRGIRLILDLVVNHTSDEHPWFIESRSSKDNPKRDWYIWRDGKNGKEPNNWESIFSGSAWKYDELTQQWFMHVFSARQPDLNWENHDMRKAVYEMICWWLDRGIDGFRIDAFTHTRKEPGLADMPNPENFEYVPSYPKHMNVPGVLEYVQDLSQNTFQKYDCMTVGEANGVNAEHAAEWVGETKGRFNMVIQFEHVGLWDTNPDQRFNMKELKRVFANWQKGLEGIGWNALFVENHDVPRINSKWGDNKHHWHESSTAIATMYFMMQGTPFIYQGQEIGMTNTHFNGPEDFNDVSAKNYFVVKRKEGMTDAEITAELNHTSRDNARTPMQWDSSHNAGFSTGTPWLKVNPNHKHINVAAQLDDQNSIFNYYRRMIRLRRQHEGLIYGSFDMVAPHHKEVFAYTRTYGSEKFFIISNMTKKTVHVEIGPIHLRPEGLLMANMEVTDHGMEHNLHLKPFEARIYKI
ncbi:alpha-glucosidase [Bdellovibrio sp. SKB1291214]|uniref:glycoside hydrolase family 13 protein n=1 Tax=Bdellovibrio sp. SKB1291214 TaxID=1732569 RepID=UPI000B51E249|nr:alpha-glucosidase [Bdellovibrio sp. SKB1291214]UYL08950.1 alpha-glucosidase [Bdellovibrio sp. SKB1291214]